MAREKLPGLRTLGFVLIAAGAIWIAGCNVDITGVGSPSGRIDLSFTIAGKTITLSLGSAGIFPVGPGMQTTNVASLKPFDEAPTDTPSTAVARLLSSSVTILPPDSNGDKRYAYQLASINGTANLHVLIAPGDDALPCNTGVSIGTWTITAENGAVSDISEDLNLSHAAIGAMLGNDIKVCMEMQADFEASVHVDRFFLEFGPDDDVEPPIGGACCYAENDGSQSCIDIGSIGILDTAEDCIRVFGGVPQGEGTSCATVTCDDPFEACCFDDGNCLQMMPDRCLGFWPDPGTPQGPGSTCGNVECEATQGPAETEACCYFGDCLGDLHPDTCRMGRGEARGLGSTCANTDCTVDATEACCLTDGSCDDATREDCGSMGGIPRGVGTRCADTVCPATTVACCLPDGSCAQQTSTACATADGTAGALGTTCADVTCPEPSEPKWVLVDTITNSADAPTVYTRTDRYEGSVTTYTITPTSISEVAVQFERGVEEFNTTLTSTFDGPPQELVPGETVQLNVEFSHSGWANTELSGAPAIRFEPRGDGIARVDGDGSYFYGPWADGFTGESTWTNEFSVPAVHDGEIAIIAGWWNCSPCNIVWVYEAE